MSSLIDTSVLIDHSRGVPAARRALFDAIDRGALHSSEAVRAELLILIRDRELRLIEPLLEAITWHPVDRRVAELAGELGRRWLPAYNGIDAADFVIAATAIHLEAQLLTRNVKHFPMFEGLVAPY
ncbi:type II toxin-antitoxin system VapC family toxin [Microbacterium capsulatum]|uniref:Ribonuclease VapC n=1 Tax=Microbacterium capsulatum TaxID=3041921 RepID=A0ABU0XJ32_9MICO|nr:type II toxin-antitoxin system VapC family toxin [Microbacterium sp. ASV81]MDQ4214852.1 type II toxin-antitoxin system VapC family toxin [Microbacterium sp. ASV81]